MRATSTVPLLSCMTPPVPVLGPAIAPGAAVAVAGTRVAVAGVVGVAAGLVAVAVTVAPAGKEPDAVPIAGSHRTSKVPTSVTTLAPSPLAPGMRSPCPEKDRPG